MSKFHWSVDSIVLKDNVVFGHGWAFHEELEIKKIDFYSSATTLVASSVRIPVDFGKMRKDVSRAYSNFEQAANSGFLIFGKLPGSLAQDTLMDFQLSDGSVTTVCIPNASLFPLDSHHSKARHLFKQALRGVLLGLNDLLHGHYSALWNKVHKLFSRLLQLRPSVSLQSTLSDIKKSEGVIFLIDHELGGGANLYRDKFVKQRIMSGTTVVTLTFHVKTLSYYLIVRNSHIDFRYAIADLESAMRIAKSLAISQIVYNNAVSFPCPEVLVTSLQKLKKDTGANFLFLLHDYFAICPSQFLLNHQGSFCGLPNSIECSKCLPSNRFGFVTLSEKLDIDSWRQDWGNTLEIADEIRFFSTSSLHLFLKAYPDFPVEKTTVVPHALDHLDVTHLQLKSDARLRIGIVGNVGFHKGAVIVQALSAEIKRTNANAEIQIIGMIDGVIDEEIISQTGPYDHANLIHLIEDSGANIMFFPSIWPETFSYVVHELMQLNLPVAAFNFGAPSESLNTYSKGLVLKSMHAKEILEELMAFHNAIYLV